MRIGVTENPHAAFICRACASLAVMLLVWMMASSSVLHAASAVDPTPELEPIDVVRIQLAALQATDGTSVDDNLRQVWLMAHPDNKRSLGSVARFRALLSSPGYRNLVNHRAHDVFAARISDGISEFYVTVVAQDGSMSAFMWVIAKVTEGDHAGCWMTIAVSPAVALNRSA